MGEQLTRRQWAGFDAFSLVCLVAFFSSIPFLLAPLDLIRSLLSDVSTTVLLEPFVATPFLAAITLAAMFTSLAMLFVCLLKTAYARLGQRLLIIAGVAYLIGMLTVSATAFVPDLPSALILTSGVLLGVGGALLCMAWAREVRLPDYRRALISLLMLGAGVFALDSGLLLLATAPRAIMLFLLAAVGTLGCLKCAFATNRNAGQPTTSGSNWWDVFGRLDMSLLEGGSDFGTPLTRTMFFIVTPAVVFLLFIAGMNMHHSTYEEFPVEFVGGIIALICAAPLLFVKGERASINTAYRFYLPILAVVVFVVGDFAPIDERGLLLNVGVYVFCFVYGLLLCAMIVTMMSRMKSLSLPAACMLVIATCLIALLSYTRIDAGILGVYQLNVLLALLLIAAVLLAVMPSSRVWRLIIEGIEGTDSGDKATMSRGSMTLEERCDRLAQACGLTPRESEILRFLGRGYGSAYIADALVIAESTVRSHVKSIYRKIGVSSREELISRIDEIGETA